MNYRDELILQWVNQQGKASVIEPADIVIFPVENHSSRFE